MCMVLIWTIWVPICIPYAILSTTNGGSSQLPLLFSAIVNVQNVNATQVYMPKRSIHWEATLRPRTIYIMMNSPVEDDDAVDDDDDDDDDDIYIASDGVLFHIPTKVIN